MLFTDFALKPDNFILDLSSLNALLWPGYSQGKISGPLQDVDARA